MAKAHKQVAEKYDVVAVDSAGASRYRYDTLQEARVLAKYLRANLKGTKVSIEKVRIYEATFTMRGE